MPAEVSANLARFDGIRYSRIKNYELGTKNVKVIYFKQSGDGFGVEAKRRIILGTFVLSSGYYDAYYEKAQRVMALVKADFDAAFQEVDVILTPVSPTVAFKIGERVADPLSMYLSDIFTIPVNLAGLPGISIPVRTQRGADKTQTNAEGVPRESAPSQPSSASLPIGFQLIGRHFREADILGLGMFYEKI